MKRPYRLHTPVVNEVLSGPIRPGEIDRSPKPIPGISVVSGRAEIVGNCPRCQGPIRRMLHSGKTWESCVDPNCDWYSGTRDYKPTGEGP